MADADGGVALDGRAVDEARPGGIVIQARLNAFRLPKIPLELVEIYESFWHESASSTITGVSSSSGASSRSNSTQTIDVQRRPGWAATASRTARAKHVAATVAETMPLCVIG